MSKDKLQKEYDKLSDRLIDLEIKFIEPHNNPMEAPSDYNLDVQSFCIMAHAAFEQFFEDICLYMLERISSEFCSPQRRISIGTACLLHFECNDVSLEDKWNDSDTLSDYVQQKIAEQKSALSSYAMKKNHGADLKYLKKLLLPVGLDIPHAVQYTSSLERLKNVRGTYAHSYNRTNRPISPDDARTIVSDIYDMAGELKKKAIDIFAVVTASFLVLAHIAVILAVINSYQYYDIYPSIFISVVAIVVCLLIISNIVFFVGFNHKKKF